MVRSRIMVTGVNGFVGGHLARELKARGHEIIGVGLSGDASTALANILSSYHRCDLSDPEQVAQLPLADIDGVVNLAGLANVGASFAEPDKYMHINVAVLSVLGDRLLEIGREARVLAISTGAVYASDQTLPLTEESKTIDNGSPYALSKLAMERAAHELAGKGLDCVIARPFNHAGPGQEAGFLIPDLYQKLTAGLSSGTAVKVGNLQSKRDYTDVRDVARAYCDLVTTKTLYFDTYNVCSGTSRTGEEILQTLLQSMGIREDQIKIETDESLIRPNDPPNLYGSHARLTDEAGWEPAIGLQKTISDFVASERDR